MAYQMLALVIGWQVYELTNSAFDLGLVGLIQFVPAVVLTLLVGHAADRLSTIVFGISTWLPLSLFALAVLGASDAVSIVVRFSLVQIETPTPCAAASAP